MSEQSVCICIHMYIHVSVRVSIHISVHMSVHMSIHTGQPLIPKLQAPPSKDGEDLLKVDIDMCVDMRVGMLIEIRMDTCLPPVQTCSYKVVCTRV